MTISDSLSPRILLAIMLATLALETVDVWRSWGAGVEVMVTMDECYHLCGGAIGTWAPQFCTCATSRVTP